MNTIFLLHQEIFGEGSTFLAFGSTLARAVEAHSEIAAKAPSDSREGHYWIDEYPVDAVPTIKHTAGYAPSAKTLECLRRYSPTGEVVQDNTVERRPSSPSM